ncbi:MAG: hypothetical protein MPJ78_04635 [Hyphomicrobiaceae bacterium]|nr:hypothetical protein [Hyphomicrobiaceae bacterium]
MTPVLTRRLYIVTWLLLGAISLGYFYALFQHTYRPSLSDAVASLPSTDGTQAKTPSLAATADPGVSRALSHMRQEIDRLRASLDAAEREKAALQAHIRELEAAYGPSTASIPPEPKNPRADDLTPDRANARKERSGPRPKVDVTMLPMPADGFVEEIPEAPLPIAGRAKPRRTQFAVRLAAGLTAAATAKRWKELVGRHGTLLQDLSPHAVPLASARGNRRYSLIAGPFKNAAGAALLCARINAAGTTCEGTVFSGEPLDRLAAR